LRGKTAEDQRLLELLDPAAEAAGYEIVRLRLMGGERARRLQVMAERADGTMQVDDCAQLARALSHLMDAADPIPGEYLLEVSSPGIDRPLTRLADFAAYEGFEARIEIDRLADGRKRFKGALAGVEDEAVAIDLEGEEASTLLPFSWIVEARLVITDALMRRGADARAARLAQESHAPPPVSEGDREAVEGARAWRGPLRREPPSSASPTLPPEGEECLSPKDQSP